GEGRRRGAAHAEHGVAHRQRLRTGRVLRGFGAGACLRRHLLLTITTPAPAEIDASRKLARETAPWRKTEGELPRAGTDHRRCVTHAGGLGGILLGAEAETTRTAGLDGART